MNYKTYTNHPKLSCKIRRKFITHVICPRVSFMNTCNLFKDMDNSMAEDYQFNSKSYYDFRC